MRRIGRTLKIDVSIIRLIFIISVFFGGTGIFIYLLLYALLPKKPLNEETIEVESENIEEETMESSARIIRPWKDRMIAGVCAALSNYLKIDVSLIRVIFILMSLGGGVGIILYIIFWFMFPNEDASER